MKPTRVLRPLALAALLARCTPSAPPADAATEAATGAAGDTAVEPDALELDATAPTPPWREPYTIGPRARFPQGFLWGSATAPYQIEGGLANTDWGAWERLGRIVNNDSADRGPDSLNRLADDVRTLTETSQNAYRFGIEWARLFPTREAWQRCAGATGDEAARATACRAAANAEGLAYYHRLLTLLRERNITPLATVQHFSLPSYLNDLSQDWRSQGWMRAGIAQDIAAYAGFVAAEYGGQVDWWVTINEPLVVATVGYLDGRTPPGQTLQVDAVLQVARNMIRSHAAMFDAIKRNDTRTAHATGPLSPVRPAYVSIAHHVRKFYGHNPSDARDARAAQRTHYLFNELFVNAITRGDLDENGDGTITGSEPRGDASLRDRLDYLGINYYSLVTVRSSPLLPITGGLPLPDETPRGLPKTDFGWDIYPRGFQEMLEWAGTYNLPIVVTENGLADSSDVNRPRFLAEHLGALAAAMQGSGGRTGVRVLGYFHWSTIDNFEWVAGYCPHFGLYRVDFNDPLRPRTPRPSAMLYRQIIMAGEVSDALLAAQPAYRSAERFCPTQAMTMMPPPRDGGT